MLKSFTGFEGPVDWPEDVAGGLYKGLTQLWIAESKYAILLADAPGHGVYAEDGDSRDAYPDGDPDGRDVCELIKDYARKDIYFTAIKMDSSTEKMFKMMN